MQLIKKIISWFISLFKKLFKKKTKKSIKSSQIKKKGISSKKEIAITTINNDTMPSYMYISKNEKDLLIKKIKDIKNDIEKMSVDYLNQEILEFNSILDECITKDNNELKERVLSFKKQLSKGIDKSTNKEFDLLKNYLPIHKKESISSKYYKICNDSEIINDDIKKVDIIINTIEKKNVSIVERNSLVETIDNLKNSDNKDITKNLDNYNKDMLYIMQNLNKNIIDKVKINYKKVNYITLTTELVDEVDTRLKKIEDNYSSHRYNKYYYEREIEKIKKHILELKELKNKPYVYNEILKLRKELYTKSKDKYDILYNNEVFLNINKKCDDLISKVNAKVVDIKKTNAKADKPKKKSDYLENILLRYQDMTMARAIIMDMESINFQNDKEMILYIKNMYNGFTTNLNIPFNFERNKEKTELVILFNSLNKVNCYLKNEKYISIEHINFRMNDLLDAVNVKKEELSNTMLAKYNIDIKDSVVDDKINKLLLNEKTDIGKKLVKQNKEKLS